MIQRMGLGRHIILGEITKRPCLVAILRIIDDKISTTSRVPSCLLLQKENLQTLVPEKY